MQTEPVGRSANWAQHIDCLCELQQRDQVWLVRRHRVSWLMRPIHLTVGTICAVFTSRVAGTLTEGSLIAASTVSSGRLTGEYCEIRGCPAEAIAERGSDVHHAVGQRSSNARPFARSAAYPLQWLPVFLIVSETDTPPTSPPPLLAPPPPMPLSPRQGKGNQAGKLAGKQTRKGKQAGKGKDQGEGTGKGTGTGEVVGKETVVLTLTARGSLSDFSYNEKTSLKQKVADAAGVDKSLVTIRVHVAAASVSITATIAVPASTTAAVVQSSLFSTLGTVDAASAALGVTVEEVPTINIVLATEPPPTLAPGSQFPVEALWALLPFSVLFVAALVLFYRYRYRVLLRDRANAVLSRDRAHVDLQIMAHQMQKVQTHKTDGPIASSRSRLDSLPPGPPSSAASGYNTTPPLTREGADRKHNAAAAAPGAAPPTEQRTPHPTWTEAGRQRFFAGSTGAKRARAALIAPAHLAPATSSGPERVELEELAVLVEMADDETVAVLQGIISPEHAGSPAQAAPHFGNMLSQAEQQIQQNDLPMRVGLAKLAALAEMASDDETTVRVPSPTASALWCPPWEHAWASAPGSASYNSSCSSDDSGPAPGNTATPVPPPTRAAPPVEPPAPPAAPPPLPADLAQMFDEPIGLGAAPAAPFAASPTLATIVVDSAATPATPPAPETVAAAQDVVSPGHAGSPVQAPAYRGSMPAQANQQMQIQRAVPVQCGSRLTAAPACSSISMQLAASPSISGFGTDVSEPHLLFARLFTPKHPSTLPRSQWLSYARLSSMVRPYVPARVWKQGPGNLKQLVIEWCQNHRAYSGLAQSAWCKRLPEDEALPSRRQPKVYKFCLECTP